MYELAKEEEFYQQQYCGCIFSLRDTNNWRQSKGREKIAIGETWYQAQLDEAEKSRH
jgi:predicted adenine nucleotide alpha hydrolase (AANH) superfamily ATPase